MQSSFDIHTYMKQAKKRDIRYTYKTSYKTESFREYKRTISKKLRKYAGGILIEVELWRLVPSFDLYLIGVQTK